MSRDKILCPGTSRDKITFPKEHKKQEMDVLFVPGQRDNGTSRPGLSRDVPSLGNTNLELLNLGTYVKLGPFQFFPAHCRTPVTCKIRPSKDQSILNFVGFLVEMMTSKSLFEIN